MRYSGYAQRSDLGVDLRSNECLVMHCGFAQRANPLRQGSYFESAASAAEHQRLYAKATKTALSSHEQITCGMVGSGVFPKNGSK